MDKARENENKLIAECLKGEETACRSLFTRYRPLVSGIAYRMSNSREDYKDLVQDIFIKIFRALKSFKGGARLSTWIYRVALNESYAYLKQNKTEKSRTVSLIYDPKDPVPDSAENAEEKRHKKRIREIEPFIERMGEKYSRIFNLLCMGLNQEEIAEVLEIPLGTVKSRLSTIRKTAINSMGKRQENG
ncbi:MAG: RNA polymerase sigma factor [Fibrobacterota bacterium]